MAPVRMSDGAREERLRRLGVASGRGLSPAGGTRNAVPWSVSMETPQAKAAAGLLRGAGTFVPDTVLPYMEDMRAGRFPGPVAPRLERRNPLNAPYRERSAGERLVSTLPTPASRDAARMATHGLARTGNMLLRLADIPNRVFGNTRSRLQDLYEASERGLENDAYEDQSGVPQVGETAVHLASAGVLGKALPAVFGANVGADTYEMAKYTGASEGEALAKGIGHGVVDTAIWTLGQGLASKYLPEAWQWLGRELTGATRGAASSVTSDAVLNSLGADISGEEMAKRAAHAAWMVPLLGMLKMGGKRREEAMSLLKKARPDLAGAKADKVIETIEAEFSDPKSQKVALAWVAREGANLPDDTAQIRQALEVSSKVKGLDPMSRSPFEILSDPAYARYLPKPKPQDVKAFSNMKRYPMGVIGFDVSDDAAGRQATREMINAYMSPSSNPWCLATGKGAAKLGELGPDSEKYWKMHSAVPKQIFFQDVEGDGNLALIAFRATSRGGEGRQEYYDTSDAGYSGIPIRVKVPGDPMGRYRKMVFRPNHPPKHTLKTAEEYRIDIDRTRRLLDRPGLLDAEDRPAFERRLVELQEKLGYVQGKSVLGTFEDTAPGKVFKGDPFRDGRSQTWVQEGPQQYYDPTMRALEDADYMGEPVPDRTSFAEDYVPYVLVEDKVRTTENGITKFRTTKYADPTDWDYEPPKPGEAPKPVEIEESELVSPEWMRARGYDPENESDVHRMQEELGIQAWGNGVEAAMAVVPTKRTYMQTKSGSPETVTYGPDGRDVVSVDFEKDGVPYREEYFHSGPADRYAPVFLGDRGILGIKGLPAPSHNYLDINEPSGFRLTRNPGGEFPEVLDELKWDNGLGGFVRTSGNRRWREGDRDRPSDLSFWDTEGGRGELYRDYLDGRVSRHDVERTLVSQLEERAELDEFGDHRGLEHDLKLLREIQKDSIEGIASPEDWGIVVEDRGPDGTWSRSRPYIFTDRGQERIRMERIRMIEQVPDDPPDDWWDPPVRRPTDHTQLPPPPAEIPFAAKAGRTRGDVRVAAKAGDSPDRFAMSRNFLATDKVPDSIFGIRIVADEKDYTPEDLEFFRKHPEAGGYYDLGEEESPEEAPVQAAKGGETFDTPIPEELRPDYDAWYAQLPKNLQYTGDYDLQGAWLEKLGRPKRYEASQNGHLDDYGKKPNHITFSTGSKWHDPKVPERTGGEWKQAKDGSWDFYPGTGNQASDDELEAYFGKYEKGNRVHRREARRGKYPGIANNPGNVEKHERRSDKTLFDGEIGGGRRPRRFANFDDPVKGLHAMAAVLARRANDLERAGKPFTIGNYVPSYAPASENDVEGYIGNMVRYSGLGRDTALDRWNVDDMAKLLKTAVRFESGKPHSDWFTDEEYRAAAERLQEGAAD